jgi:hypothetical protein
MKNSFNAVRTLIMTSAVALMYLAGVTPGYADLVKVPVITYISRPSNDTYPVVHIKWASRLVDIPPLFLDEKAQNIDDNDEFNIQVHVPGTNSYFLKLNSDSPRAVPVDANKSYRELLTEWIETNGASGSGTDRYVHTDPVDGQCYQFGYGRGQEHVMPGTECMAMPAPEVSCNWDSGSSTIALGTATDDSSWKKLSGKTTITLGCSGETSVSFKVDQASKPVGSGGDSALTLTAYQGPNKIDWPADTMTSQKKVALDLVAGTSGKAPAAGKYNANFVITANWE